MRGGLTRLLRGVAGRAQTEPALPSDATRVERFWTQHTVNSQPFATARESIEYLEWRFSEYPLFRELMDLWGDHGGEVVLDYGCGPGDDLVGLALYSGASVVVGADVSTKALSLADARVRLHGLADDKVRLLHVRDSRVGLPLDEGSVDYVHCGGVLQHVTDPARVLAEFARVLRPGGRARVMVYNRHSLYYHLYTAYVRMVLEGAFGGLTVDDAFTRNTDGPDCPVSRSYAPSEFQELCEGAGFDTRYLGGYFATVELENARDHLGAATLDPRLPVQHREFLASLTRDERGYILHEGAYAGIGGVYALERRELVHA